MKKIFAFVLAMVMVACMFTACGVATYYDSETHTEVAFVFADLVAIPEYDNLYYSVNTRTVYYGDFVGQESYMAPYLSNGNGCKYLDNEIVEVVEGEVVAVVEITAWG